MKELWIATGNAHKLEEFKNMLPDVKILSLKDLKEPLDIIENGKTFEENALIKARTLYEKVKQPVISDDSGIEVDAMDKKPGVHSARWMGEDTSYTIKNQAVIDACKGKEKTARYVCVIAYIDENGRENVYRAECEGLINDKPIGENGFGYDPIFYYPPYGTTLANVSEEKKNEISHRAKALRLLEKDLKK